MSDIEAFKDLYPTKIRCCRDCKSGSISFWKVRWKVWANEEHKAAKGDPCLMELGVHFCEPCMKEMTLANFKRDFILPETVEALNQAFDQIRKAHPDWNTLELDWRRR